tara:strand:+ start:1789 stop:2181 length:393 start_codon:yes stop_codon:yes gene_type:complete
LIEYAHLDMRSIRALIMKSTSVLFCAMMILTSFSPGCTSQDSSEEIAELEVILEIVIGEDGENDSMNATAKVTGGESPYNYQWELDGSQMLSMKSYLKMSNLSEGQHVVSVSVSSKDGQADQITASFTIE